jgi:ParB-like chromosome segregation protein Spo0J
MARTQPATSSGIEGLDNAIVASGFRTEFDPTFPRADIQKHLQHRHSSDLNGQAARRYAAMFKAGSVPPPVGVTRDGLMLWGNHRDKGAELAGFDTLPAIVFDVDGLNADDHTLDLLLSLAVEENAPHGVPYTAQDRTDRAKSLLNLGYTNRSVSAKLGLTAAQVSAIKKELDAEQRLVTLGLDLDDVQRNVKQALGGPAPRALNDAPFAALVKLTRDAALTAPDIVAHARAAKASGSDKNALDYLDQVRQDLSEAIASVKISGKPIRPTPVGKLRGALRQVVGLCDATVNPSIYRDHTDGVVDTVQLLDDALACLQAIRAVQVLPEDESED